MQMTSKYFVVAGLLASLGWAGVASAEPGPDIDFSRDVQPVFQQHCVKCHGGVKREGGLSLLAPHDAFRPAESGATAVVSRRPEASELVRRITAADPDERMPAEGPALSAAQIEMLRRWITAGATWPAHWSFAAIRRPAPPMVKNEAWVRNSIDRFVLARLEAEGIEPAPEADQYTLIRRLTLDLTGLPPTLEEIDAFQQSAIRNPHSTGSSIACWPARTLASVGDGIGWTWRVTPIPTATRSTSRGRTLIAGATG